MVSPESANEETCVEAKSKKKGRKRTHKKKTKQKQNVSQVKISDLSQLGDQLVVKDWRVPMVMPTK